jgi:Domain of unknown function (DU1801)
MALGERMQPVKVRSVEECLALLPPGELELTEEFRALVMECVPQAKERISFNVPFYKLRKDICFIWPASVLWGKTKTYDGVRFGFTYGNLLIDEHGFLEKGGRKQVYWHNFTRLTAKDMTVLQQLLYQAVLVDGEKHRSIADRS